MNVFRNRVLQFWRSLETLDERIYYMLLSVADIAGLISTIVGFIQKLNIGTLCLTFLTFVFTVLLSVISVRHPEQRKIQKIVLIIAINFFFFPASFFLSGGIHSGMILFLLTGLFLVGITLRGKLSGYIFVASLVAMEMTLFFASLYPNLTIPMNEQQHYLDVEVTLFLTSMSVYAITTLILSAYDRECRQNEKLMEKLRNLSTRDELSGLFNRRKLFQRLEMIYSSHPAEQSEKFSREKMYIAMFDVDNFKHLNDTYGHSFGDVVLTAVAKVLDNAANPQNGELSSRYGGEEFVSILAADSLDEAYSKADTVRQQISELRFEEVPDLVVTISGGVVACSSEDEIKLIMHDVDECLYKAKAAGKNRIFCH